MADRALLVTQLIELGRLLYANGIIRARAGNLSARFDPESMLITRSRTHKGLLTEADVLLVDLHGQPLEDGTPSSEVLLHAAAYAADPTVMAVGHAHPINCTELAHREVALQVGLAEEGAPVLGAPPLIQDYPQQERAQVWHQAVKSGTRAALLTHHGLVVAGTSSQDVLCKMELAEWIADLQLRLLKVSSPACGCGQKP